MLYFPRHAIRRTYSNFRLKIYYGSTKWVYFVFFSRALYGYKMYRQYQSIFCGHINPILRLQLSPFRFYDVFTPFWTHHRACGNNYHGLFYFWTPTANCVFVPVIFFFQLTYTRAWHAAASSYTATAYGAPDDVRCQHWGIARNACIRLTLRLQTHICAREICF